MAKANNNSAKLVVLLERLLVWRGAGDKTKKDFVSYIWATIPRARVLIVICAIQMLVFSVWLWLLQEKLYPGHIDAYKFFSIVITAMQLMAIAAIVIKNAFFRIDNDDNIDISRIMKYLSVYSRSLPEGITKDSVKELARINLYYFHKYWSRFWISSLLLFAVLLADAMRHDFAQRLPDVSNAFTPSGKMGVSVVINVLVLLFNTTGAVCVFMCFKLVHDPLNLKSKLSDQIEGIKNLSSSLYVAVVLMVLMYAAYGIKIYTTRYEDLSVKDFVIIRRTAPRQTDLLITSYALRDSLLMAKADTALASMVDTLRITKGSKGEESLLGFYKWGINRDINKDFQIVSGMLFCIALALLLARLDSRLANISYKLIAIMFGYAPVQPLLNFVQNGPMLMTACVLFFAFVFKVMFFLGIDYAISTRRLTDMFIAFPYYQEMIETEGWPQEPATKTTES